MTGNSLITTIDITNINKETTDIENSPEESVNKPETGDSIGYVLALMLTVGTVLGVSRLSIKKSSK